MKPFAALLVIDEKKNRRWDCGESVLGRNSQFSRRRLRLPNSHCCSLGWVWAAWELRAAKLIEVVLSRVVLLGETVSIKIAR